MLPIGSAFLTINITRSFLVRNNLRKKLIPSSFHLFCHLPLARMAPAGDLGKGVPPLLGTKINFIRIHTSVFHKQQQDSHIQNILVYEGILKTRIKRVKLLSLTSSLTGFAILPVVIKELSQTSIGISCGVALFSSFFLSTPFLLDWITRRYVTQLLYNPSTGLFTATTFNIICQQNDLHFSADDVTVPDLPGMLTSFHVKGKPLFVDANQVKDIDAYSLMMGYDKPLDLKLPMEEKKENVS